MAKKTKSRSSPKQQKNTQKRNSSPSPTNGNAADSHALNSFLMQTTGFKMLDGNGYDDGGLADLQLLFDLEDCFQKKMLGVKYFNALRLDELPRAKEGPLSRLNRRDQKLALAALLYQSQEESHSVFVDSVDGQEDRKTIEYRTNRLNQAKDALVRSLSLQETSCVAVTLSELCKRQLALKGKCGAIEALQYAEKALLVAGEGSWSISDVALEGSTFFNKSKMPGLANKASLRLRPLRLSQLCRRQALTQRGNALVALGRQMEARAAYEQVIPLLIDEPRCARIDWECHSLHLNIGNTFDVKSGEFDIANKHYSLAEQLGTDHLQEKGGSAIDGQGMIDGARRARAFALNKAGRLDEAKIILKDVLQSQISLQIQNKKKEQEEIDAANKLNSEGASYFQRLLEETHSSSMVVPAT
eukprot:CAMPEP_0178939030 /NCGR_PEP_ID=MMETSP0786-20121207/26658_1 /TAXON_ID=186022 /ORGANISM="Thalassionema frauenfeldii, Strain CCMP 1798" /LENGTH=414 /DNA_ID=CAMNT_0020617811 /DNA_START=149 /DNA_END=1393 /DNA_ORIENTATION=-